MRGYELKNRLIIMVLLVLFIFSAVLGVSFSVLSSNSSVSVKSSSGQEVLGSTDYGNVVKTGPYGNISSNVRIAYVVGVHPLESNAHHAVIESIQSIVVPLNIVITYTM